METKKKIEEISFNIYKKIDETIYKSINIDFIKFQLLKKGKKSEAKNTEK